MLFLPLEFHEVKIDALVDSGAYVNAISERDAKKGHEAPQCIIHKAPPPPFKVEYANAARTTYRNLHHEISNWRL